MDEYQLNFINYFEKTQKALFDSLQDSCEIIEECLKIVPRFKPIRKVIATQLRLLLVDNKNSLVIKAFGQFKLPALKTSYVNIYDDLYCINFNNITDMFESDFDDIELDAWLKQSLYYFDRDVYDLPKKFNDIFFNQILNKFKKNSDEYCFIKSNFYTKKVVDKDGVVRIYNLLNEKISFENRTKLFNLLNSRGYNNLTIGMLIKLVADKEGAHSDSNTPIGLLFSNINDDRVTYLDAIALTVVVKIREYIDRFK